MSTAVSSVTLPNPVLGLVLWHLLVSHPALKTQPTKWESTR